MVIDINIIQVVPILENNYFVIFSLQCPKIVQEKDIVSKYKYVIRK